MKDDGDSNNNSHDRCADDDGGITYMYFWGTHVIACWKS